MFAIGDHDWPGISKLIEEMGEVQQVCGKLLGTRGDTKHWNVPDLKASLEDELADLMAAIDFVSMQSDLDLKRMNARAEEKLATFTGWHRDEIKP